MAARDRSARDDRTRGGTARRTGSAAARDRGTGGIRPAGNRRPQAATGRPAGPAAGPVSADGLIVGEAPRAARVAGALLVLAGLAGAAALFPLYLVVGGQELTLGRGVGGVLVGLVVPLASVTVGGGLAAGRVPRFGLAYAGVGGVLALGSLLIEVYRGSSSTVRPGIEVLAGERVLTSTVTTGAGWWLQVLALGLTVLAGGCAAAVWGRTLMEDRGALDPARPALAGGAVLLGVLTVLCLALPAADVPDRLVADPATGLEVVVEQQGPQALLERPGLALLGGLLLAGAVLLGAVLAPSLRPRLGAVGGLLALTVTVLAAGLTGLRDAVAGPDLEWTVPGAGLLAAGVAYGLLTVLAWRLRRTPAP
ncbi:hypothetical protein JOD57_001732 [Geodermatophilus bullaregiensis]|uniref:hypothetical protein n=1 Tax=Geodermatophilus bullaregiensis TaxID=1564160 RepID=UPI0027DE9F7C|nr:hypothetical protein [Geodermatophilus bullaregiensis]MBM7805895.1 hypothetical protein [Geodermatophilus bullaregiensis]